MWWQTAWDAVATPNDPAARTRTIVTVATAAAVTAVVSDVWHRYQRRTRMRKLRRELGADMRREKSASSSSDLASRRQSTAASSSSNLAVAEGSLENSVKMRLAKASADAAADLAAAPLRPLKPLGDGAETLLREQLARNYAFLGEEGMQRLRGSFVVVVGLGGVGGHAAHMLVRSGVMRLRLVDFDQVTLSSLNRHCLATLSDVGSSKAACLARRFAEIFPWADVEPVVEAFSAATADRVLSGSPDYVLDCIDNLDTKVELIRQCKQRGLRIVSSMGSGTKIDPSRVQIADISDTYEDPLSRAVRVRLRLVGIHGGVPVVYSNEKPGAVKLLPLEDSQVADAHDYAALDGFRVRILPVVGPLPGMFGMAMAAHVTAVLSGFPVRPLAIKGRPKVYERVWSDLCVFEARHPDAPRPGSLRLCEDDAVYFFEDVFHGKSFLSGKQDKVVLVRWDNRRPADFDNIVCLTRSEYQRHRAVRGEDLVREYGAEVVDQLSGVLRAQQPFLKWRLGNYSR